MHKSLASIFTLVILSCCCALAQDSDSLQVPDTARVLNEIVIQAYAYKRPFSEVPASVAVVSQTDFERFNNTSLLPAVNTVPGVRMEERSPGSYRFSIRGSLLRSPFGVRNVKAYWNGLPFTDGGGNTYLNLLDFNSIGSMEIIKGPGGSLYGAGTGGVILLQSPSSKRDQLQLSTVFGNYGLQRYHLSAETHVKKSDFKLQYAHQQSDGYREQTSMRRDAISGDISFRLNSHHTLSTTAFYTDLFYETPGGLTKTQYDANPKQARPSAGFSRGAAEQKAAVTNKTGYLGFIDDYQWNDMWSTQTGIYASLTDFENPAIRNYEIRDERNAGARTQTQYVFEKSLKGKFTFGGEYQYFNSPIAVFGNTFGAIDTVQTDDKLTSSLLLFFSQAELDLPSDFYLTIGASANFLKYKFSTLQPEPSIQQKRNFDPVLSPRIALLKKFNSVSVFASVSQGFSPPSLAEVRPSSGSYNNNLNSERGVNYEIGLRGSFQKPRLTYDISTYEFRLDETIVIQRAADGAEFFVNAGKTVQRGIEATLSWRPVIESELVKGLSFWMSYTYNHYHFKNYEQDGNNFSGNRLTGIAPTIALWGVDMTMKKIYFNLTANYTDALPLNDANTEYASEYFLLGGRIGFRSSLTNNFQYDLFFGVDNAFDKKYSLGNDLNAVGGRYYNAAPPRNFYFGIKLNPFFEKKPN